MTIDQRLKTNLLMINSWRGAEIIDDARDCYADNPDEKVDVDEPRFKGHVGRDNVGFQQGKHDDEENAGEHMCNQLSHTLKIIQIKNISCKKTAKYKTLLDGASPNLFGSVISMQAWLQRSPFEVVFRLRATPFAQDDNSAHRLQPTAYFLPSTHLLSFHPYKPLNIGPHYEH